MDPLAGNKEPAPQDPEAGGASARAEVEVPEDPDRGAFCLKKLWPQAHVAACPMLAMRSAQSHVCECIPKYCAEADGKCHDQLAARANIDFRMAPRANQNMFLWAKSSDQGPSLSFKPGWPGDDTEAVWNMVAQPDSRAVLISTKGTWAAGPGARVLDIDRATMTPRMAPLEAAGQAEFRIVEAGAGQGHRVFLKHLRTGYFLAVADPHWGRAARPAVGDPNAEPVPVHAPELTVSPDPTPGAAFDLWPPDVVQLLANEGLMDRLPSDEQTADAVSSHLRASPAMAHGLAPLRHPLIVVLASLLVIAGALAGAAWRAQGSIDDRSLYEKARDPKRPAAAKSQAYVRTPLRG